MLTSPREPLPYTVYRVRPPHPGWGWRRIRRILLAAGLISLIPALVSFASTMTQPSNSSFFINAVEWMRSNGARALVNAIENEYYSLTAPAKGGPPLKHLSRQQGALAVRPPAPVVVHHYYRPPNIVPLTRGLPGEGVWEPTYADGGSRPPVLITQFRLDPAVSGNAGAERADGQPGPGGGADVAALAPGGHLQQRLQAVGLRGGIRLQRPHLRADARRVRDDRQVHRWQREHHQLDGWPAGAAGRGVGAPESAADRRRRPTEPQPQRQLAMGGDARQPGAGLALGGRD